MTNPCACCHALWIKFKLTATLSQTSVSALALVYTGDDHVRQYWQGDDPDPSNNGLQVYNLEVSQPAGTGPAYRFSGAFGEVGLACLDDSDPTNLKYRIVQLSLSGPLLGYYSGSSAALAQGNTGIFQIVDDQYNKVLDQNGNPITVTARALADIMEAAAIAEIWYDRYQREWYAMPISRHQPRFGVSASSSPGGGGIVLAQGTTGTIELFDSHGNDANFSQDHVYALNDILNGEQVMLYYDYWQFQWYAISYTKPLIGQVTVMLPANDAGLTGTVKFYDSNLDALDPPLTVANQIAAPFSDLPVGTWVLVFWDFDAEQFYAVPAPVAGPLLVKFTYGTPWAIGSQQVNLQVYSGTPGSETAVAGSTVTAWNSFYDGISGDPASWVWLQNNGSGWYVVAVQCVKVTVVVGWRYNTATHKFEVKTQDVQLPATAAATDWKDYTTVFDMSGSQPQELAPVVDVQWNAPDLQQLTNTGTYVLEAGDEGDPTTIDTAEDCDG